MLNWLLGKRSSVTEHVPPFRYDESLVLDWNDDREGWTSSLPELGHDARIYIGPREGSEPPQSQSCKLVTEARDQILSLNNAALVFLLEERSAFVQKVYKHSLSAASFVPTGIEIFEHEETPGEYSLTYDPIFDLGAIWRVRFVQQQPIGYGFDD